MYVMSKLIEKVNVAQLVDTIFVIGIIMFGGGLAVITIGTAIDHSFFMQQIWNVFSVCAIGLVCIWIASKLSEILE